MSYSNQVNGFLFQNLIRKMTNGQDRDWLVHFVDNEEHQDIEFRKLPAMLSEFRVSQLKLWELPNYVSNYKQLLGIQY